MGYPVVPEDNTTSLDRDVIHSVHDILVLVRSNVRVVPNAGSWKRLGDSAFGYLCCRSRLGPVIELPMKALGCFKASRVGLQIVGQRDKALDRAPFVGILVKGFGAAIEVWRQGSLDRSLLGGTQFLGQGCW